MDTRANEQLQRGGPSCKSCTDSQGASAPSQVGEGTGQPSDTNRTCDYSNPAQVYERGEAGGPCRGQITGCPGASTRTESPILLPLNEMSHERATQVGGKARHPCVHMPGLTRDAGEHHSLDGCPSRTSAGTTFGTRSQPSTSWPGHRRTNCNGSAARSPGCDG